MEKHAAYCAMMRLGMKVPQTVLVPHKNPPENTRFEYTAAKYNQPFDLGEIAANIGYPLFMKPYDGGQWVGVTRIKNDERADRRLQRVRRAADAPAGVGRGLRRTSRARCRSAPRRWSWTSGPTSRCTTATRSRTAS